MRGSLMMAGALAIAVAGVTLATVAEAKIRCNGPWQIVQGNQIASPYCGDNYLAQVAHGYGSKVTASAIRNNPNTKREICQWIGHDTRVQEICAGYRVDEGSRGGRH